MRQCSVTNNIETRIYLSFLSCTFFSSLDFSSCTCIHAEDVAKQVINVTNVCLVSSHVQPYMELIWFVIESNFSSNPYFS